MIEVEIKLPISEIEKLEDDLLSFGFQKGDEIKESDIYFTSSFHDFKKHDEAFRIRRCENLTKGEVESVITFKGPKLDKVSMTRKELETGIENADVFHEILTSIGFQAVLPVIKLRKYYKKGSMTACVDQVENLGDFMELEVIVENEYQRLNALTQIEDVLKKMGYEMSQTTRTSYLTMLQKKMVI